jgi:hypothetical protein
MSHVNLMTDTVVANLAPGGLRTVLRSILTTNPEITPVLEKHVKTYIQQTIARLDLEQDQTKYFPSAITTGRVMLGCGMWPESIDLMSKILTRTLQLDNSSLDPVKGSMSSLDGDIIQAVTAIEKAQNSRQLLPQEVESIAALFDSLELCKKSQQAKHQQFLFGRSMIAVAGVLGRSMEPPSGFCAPDSISTKRIDKFKGCLETFSVGGREVPRLFTGLWQLSSPSWGVASKTDVLHQFHQYAHAGFTPYDMADHYGDAEVLFVQSPCSELIGVHV